MSQFQSLECQFNMIHPYQMSAVTLSITYGVPYARPCIETLPQQTLPQPPLTKLHEGSTLQVLKGVHTKAMRQCLSPGHEVNVWQSWDATWTYGPWTLESILFAMDPQHLPLCYLHNPELACEEFWLLASGSSNSNRVNRHINK